MAETRILLVEDERSIRELVRLNLELEGYEVILAKDGEEAVRAIETQYIDLVLLDLMIPKISGLEVLNTLRVFERYIPVIIISAKNTSTDRIQGLKLGADDYLTKPFELEELMLRIEKLVRRMDAHDPEIFSDYTFGNNHVDFKTFEALGVRGNFVLTQKEAQLLKLLITRKNEVVSRQDILKFVWGYDVFPSTRTIDNYILSFRKHFEMDPKDPKHFHSVRGVGYKFTE